MGPPVARGELIPMFDVSGALLSEHVAAQGVGQWGLGVRLSGASENSSRKALTVLTLHVLSTAIWELRLGFGDGGALAMAEPSTGLALICHPPPSCLAKTNRYLAALGALLSTLCRLLLLSQHRVCLIIASTPTPATGSWHTSQKQARLGLLYSLPCHPAGQDQTPRRHQRHRSRSRHSVSPSDHASQQLRGVLPHLGQSLRTSQGTDPSPAGGPAQATTQLRGPQVGLTTHLTQVTLRVVLALSK